MRAYRVSCGLDITLYLKDKEEASKGNSLNCTLEGETNQKLIFHVRNKVPWRGFLEEEGFHIRSTPKHHSKKQTYDIYLSKERFEALTNPPGNPIVDGGYFVSRSQFDRVDIKYFAI